VPVRSINKDVVIKLQAEQDLLIQVLENTLDSLIKSEHVDLKEYIQWSRVMVQTLMGTNDKLQCFKYSNQIKVLLQERVDCA
jgi:hypothetical protein